ncbi:HpcH/HpaI aldolase/citrate lyase family protein [Bibersteinia trehalosi]|uniref:HpcH/HpaI aldolase family protein n=1 Tax=Bibersteinia trehalosi TaxID=47735 RepID=UPI003D276B8D
MRQFDKDYLTNPFKQAVTNHQVQVGFALSSGSATVAEIVAGSGFDFLWIDGERGPNTLETVLAQARAIAAYDSHVVLRPLESDRALIKQLLDAGIQSIIAPMIETGEQAKYVAESMYYPPKGKRGFGAPGARAGRWGRIPDYAASGEQHLFLALQIESKLGVQNAEAIAKTEGVDAIFLGPADLAVDMGYYGDFSGEEMQATIKKLIQDIRGWGKSVGTLASSPGEAQRYIEWGASFVVVGADVFALAHVADSTAEAYRVLKG